MPDVSPDRSTRLSRRHAAGRSPDRPSDPPSSDQGGTSGGPSSGAVGEKVGEVAGSVGTAARGAHRHAAQAGRSEPVRKGARVGIAANGVLHLLIAWLALQIALGGGGEADQSGAVTTLAQQPFGRVLLWVLFVGFVAVVLWRLSAALFGFGYVDDAKKKLVKRLVSAGQAVVYAALAVLTVRAAVQGSAQGGGGSKATAGVLGLPGGQVLVGIIGVGVVIGGGVMIWHGAKKKFTEDQDLAAADPHARTLDVRAGQVGFIAKGFAIGVLGALIVAAAVTFDPAKANGLDSALKTLAAQPFGVVLLGLVALGIAAYGVFCFFDAKYHRV
ncbi:DUF1206 domain-containing protein [Pseudonocardia kujensis]|uniref:DUF1206 domain-containing protein n=1 Tax=Pseudonocardia kujensis TaxID=1128675 RepID=UPI001E5D9571|nr:DUF1206 domain-containing protein [Pseudonocardia kujensis]MCE0763967.1 DUF1206 domain-containing protein [Pseudonocardia kujensis]